MSNMKEIDLSLGRKMVCAGAAACTADIATFPLDVAKVRLQISSQAVVGEATGSVVYKGLFGTLFGLVKHEGFRSLYGGITPGLQRQCVYASIRLGLYEPVKDFYADLFKANSNSHSSIMMVRIASGITTGAIGITFAQPTDVVKVRMQAQSKGGTLMYSTSSEAYKKIYKTEGIRGLWKGLGPNVIRNSVVNAAELVCYDTVKDFLLRNNYLGDNIICHFTSAFAAGFCAAFVSSPIDVVKTNFMNSTGQYKNVLHCTASIAKNGGLMAFYHGFVPSYMRIGTWNIVMFVTYEQLKILAGNLSEDGKSKSLAAVQNSNKNSL